MGINKTRRLNFLDLSPASNKLAPFVHRHRTLLLSLTFIGLWGIIVSLRGDYTYQFANWKLSWAGQIEQIYSPDHQFQTVWPPFFQLISMPLGLLGFWVGKGVWELLMLASMASIFWVCRQWARGNLPSSPIRDLAVFLTFILTFRFWLGELKLHQLNGIMLAAAMLGLYWGDKKPWIGGLLLAASMNLKAVTLIIIPWLVFKRHWRLLLPTLVFMPLLGLGLPALFWGWDRTLGLWGLFHHQRAEFFYPPGAGAVQSLGNALRTYLTEGEHHLALMKLSREQFEPILIAAYGLLGFLAFWGYSFRSWGQTDKLQCLRELGLTFLVMNLVSPVTRKAHLVAMTPAVFFVVTLLLSQRLSWKIASLFGLFIALGPLTAQYLWGIEWWKNLLSLHLLTISLILLVIILVVAKGNRSPTRGT